MRSLKFIIPAVATVSAVVLGMLVWENKTFLFNELGYAKSEDMTTISQIDAKPDDPCWYQTREGIEAHAESGKLTKMRDRQMYGYETEIPLSEAVRIFNEELACDPMFKMYPPLTEDEIIAAIVAGSDQSDAAKVYTEKMNRIIENRKMPKSSLLYFGGNGIRVDSAGVPLYKIRPKGIEIYLVIDLDPEHGHKTIMPEQMLLLRKTYSGVKPAL